MNKAIILVSHGSVRPETREQLEELANRIKEKYSDYDVNLSFSGKIIIKLLKEKYNIIMKTPKEELTRLIQEGYTEIIVQSLHILPGLEFHGLLKDISEFKGANIKVGYPLLSSNTDYSKSAKAIQMLFPNLEEKQGVVLMGHGTYHPSNSGYACLQNHFYDQEKNFFIANVKGYPKLEHIIGKLHKLNINQIVLMPYLLTVGNHVYEDMIGNDNSFIKVLEKEGIKVIPYLKGLVEDVNHQDIFIEHINDAISGITLKDKFKLDA
ncbi:sirohydrochlorin cobaltochelatase [Desulfonispora thiosulfatigenes DSM 11270]|uniref:Sirohydrochlorin cobaltochelatase n=1 Tax=Desulfonispora thiosulfatigenes DSM 11270 TaxID=656914 RepID=A0A1W1VE22_DESTI|nr:sirohydrochlorin cobaltochelatase [Desulfonispora thiosulfatigenes]SMB91649.1 sirohydrochlorin cobaltochelatase [Desulfonispora thiosulfatigenes DSM 11270]